jgi:hypothetical protein
MTTISAVLLVVTATLASACQHDPSSEQAGKVQATNFCRINAAELALAKDATLNEPLKIDKVGDGWKFQIVGSLRIAADRDLPFSCRAEFQGDDTWAGTIELPSPSPKALEAAPPGLQLASGDLLEWGYSVEWLHDRIGRYLRCNGSDCEIAREALVRPYDFGAVRFNSNQFGMAVLKFDAQYAGLVVGTIVQGMGPPQKFVLDRVQESSDVKSPRERMYWRLGDTLTALEAPVTGADARAKPAGEQGMLMVTNQRILPPLSSTQLLPFE